MPQPAYAQHREHVDGVVRAVLAAAEPGAALRRAWPPDEAERATLAGAVLLAAGKASVAMARAAVEELGVKGGGGVVVGPAGSRAPASFASAGLRLFEADHPLPTQRNMIAAQAVADAARLASSRKLPVVLLLSGGASAHLTLPERGLTLSDVRAVTDALLKAGATIGELNAVRKRIEMLKGGGLARLAAPSGVYVFVLSDVLGDRVDVIGSGPAAEDATTDEGALDVLASRGVEGAAPNVVEFLRKRVKAKGLGMGGPPRAPVTNSVHTVVGSNAMAVEAARRQLEAAGFVIEEARSGVEGEAAEMGRLLAERVLGVRRVGAGPSAIVWGGETTVRVRGAGAGGFGGRNQEGATAAAVALAGHPGVVVACFATDGVDGVAPPGGKPHAGAVVTGETLGQARRAGVHAAAALEGHDSYGFVAGAGVGLVTGATGTNVNDVWVGLAY